MTLEEDSMNPIHSNRQQVNTLRIFTVLFTLLATIAIGTASPIIAASLWTPRLMAENRNATQWNGTYEVAAKKTTTVTNASSLVNPKVEEINSTWQVKRGVLICNGVFPGDYCEALGAIENATAGLGSMGVGTNAPWVGSGQCFGPIEFKWDNLGFRNFSGNCTAEPSSYGLPGSGDRARIYLEFSGKELASLGSTPLQFTSTSKLLIKAGVKYTSSKPAYSFCVPAVTVERCGKPGTTNPIGGTPSASDPNFFTYTFYVGTTSKPLPYGLILNASSGKITGTIKTSPRVVSYTITVCAKSVGRYVAGQKTDVCRNIKLNVN